MGKWGMLKEPSLTRRYHQPAFCGRVSESPPEHADELLPSAYREIRLTKTQIGSTSHLDG